MKHSDDRLMLLHYIEYVTPVTSYKSDLTIQLELLLLSIHSYVLLCVGLSHKIDRKYNEIGSCNLKKFKYVVYTLFFVSFTSTDK